jgi:creatinine amidohydrolase/Fe(II)-dependent formamide hydrolase-like protein
MRHPHKWEEMLPEEFFAEMERAPIVYWSCGAMEEHGLHMALGNDWIQMYEVCLRAAEITGGIVFPPVPFAPAGIPSLSREQLRSGQHQLYPPSLWVSRELCEQLYVELMESMDQIGFKVCIALGGHYPADLLLREIAQKSGGRIGNMLVYGGGTVDLLQDEIRDMYAADRSVGGHGGMWESALVMAIRPDWADLSRAEKVTEAPFASQLKAMGAEGLARIRDASVGLGEKLLQAATQKAVAHARELLARATGASAS